MLFVAGAYAGYLVFGHVQIRVDAWLHPFDRDVDSAYQIVQGLFGHGLGRRWSAAASARATRR